VQFFDGSDGSGGGGSIPLCGGSFSECTGIEATMEPKAIKAGGVNFGEIQRAGRVSFATVILKRGVVGGPHLWRWFELLASGAYACRMDVEVTLLHPEGEGAIMGWRMSRALPTKFKAADLNAKANEVAIEELHFVHEGLSLTGSSGK
jgi:phage tail-like protein